MTLPVKTNVPCAVCGKTVRLSLGGMLKWPVLHLKCAETWRKRQRPDPPVKAPR